MERGVTLFTVRATEPPSHEGSHDDMYALWIPKPNIREQTHTMENGTPMLVKPTPPKVMLKPPIMGIKQRATPSG